MELDAEAFEAIVVDELDQLPDRIVLYREPLLAISADEHELREEIHVTLVHEIAHFYGIDDERLHELGWA